jgi:glycosyltransferase involved in cell wall biosynthesis
VVIPVHNGMPYLRETVATILDQTRPPDELIVVENGSTDGTAEWLAGLDDPRVQVIVQPQLVSPAENWTTAVNAATGDFVKLVCADDLLLPHALEVQSQALATSADAVMVASFRRVVDSVGKVVAARRGLGRLRGTVTGATALKSCALRGVNAFGESAAVMFRREELQAEMPWDDSLPYVIDLDLYARVVHQRRVIMLPEVVAAFRISPGAWTRNLSSLQRDHFNRWIDRELGRGHIQLSRAELAGARVMAAIQATARRAAYEYALLGDRLRRRGA